MHQRSDRRKRPDIQALRGLAVAAVVAYHAMPDVVPGGFAGVDVFFVISGFLITGTLLDEHARTGRIALGRFFVRRFHRLAPMAVLVVCTTAVAMWATAPPLLRIATRIDGAASLVGLENVRLALARTDYLAAHDASPFQQYWSLGVEEQFYVVWPLVLVVLLTLVRRPAVRVGIVAALVAGSIAAMLVVDGISAPWSFFSLPTRAWELGVGALLALVVARGLRVRGAWASCLGGVGLLGAVLLLSPDVTWPGPATLLPVLATALVLVPASNVPGPRGAPVLDRVLTTPVLRWLGDRSYSIYLWHWPALVVPALALGRPLAVPELGAAIAVALVLSAVSTAVVEQRFRRWWATHPRRGWVTSALASAAAAGIVLTATTLPSLTTPLDVSPPTAHRVVAGPWTPGAVPRDLTPSIAGAAEDLPPIYADACHGGLSTRVPAGCSFSAQTSDSGPVVLWGDSHAAQWFSPLAAIARAQGRQLVTFTKSSCPSADVEVVSTELGREYRECSAFRQRALAEMEHLRPSTVVIADHALGYRGNTVVHGRFERVWERGLTASIGSLPDSVEQVVVMQDTPQWSTSPNTCLSGRLDDPAACGAPVGDVLDSGVRAVERRVADARGATLVDPVPWICGDRCDPVLWNVLAYRDANHVTDRLASVLRPRLEAALTR